MKLIDADTGAVLYTTFTDEDGNYEFNDLPAGNYKVMGVAPDGQEFTLQDVGNEDTIDSDVGENGMSGVISLAPGEEADVDLGLKEKKLGDIGGRYFCDENDNDRDDSEPGLAGKTVWLLKDGVQIASTTTDADFCFEDLEEGNYTVVFEADDKPFVDANVGDDEDDSDVEGTDGTGNGVTAEFSLAAGESKKNVDAGVEPLGPLSGRYFCDTDGDAQDNNNGDEPGVAGIKVMLLDASGNPTGRTTVTDVY